MSPNDVKELVEARYPKLVCRRRADGWAFYFGEVREGLYSTRIARVSRGGRNAPTKLKPAATARLTKQKNLEIEVTGGQAQVQDLLNRELSVWREHFGGNAVQFDAGAGLQRSPGEQVSRERRTGRRSTPMLRVGGGPDPAALSAGKFNPRREGRVLEVILNGDCDGTNRAILNYLLANPPADYDGKIREPTVRYFTKRAVEAGIIEACVVAGETVYIPLEDGPLFARATPKGLAFRRRALAAANGPLPNQPEPEELAAAEAAEMARRIPEVRKVRGRAQGFMQSQEARLAVELRAMEAANKYFSGFGYEVRDVSATNSFDLHCCRGAEELFVEVKGTVSEGESVFLTGGEVSFATDHQAKMVLFVLHSINVIESNGVARASGGEQLVFLPWKIEPGDLKPTAFQYRVSRQANASEGPRRRKG